MNLHDQVAAEAYIAEAVRHTEESMQDVAKALTALFAHPENIGVAMVVDADFIYGTARYEKYIRELKAIQKTIKEAKP